jgi:multidrug efflux pump subunit AcrA (membrane-fusion protein)
MRKAKIITALVLAMIALFTLTSCKSSGSGVSVTAYKVKADSTLGSTSYSSRLKAAKDVTVVPLVSARVTAVNFEVGASVKKGDVIFTLDDSDYRNRYSQAKAAYDISVINYQNSKNGNAGSTLLKLQQAVDAASIGVESATVAFSSAKNNYERISYMVSIGEDTAFNQQQAKNTMDNAALSLNSAKVNLTAAQQNLDISKNSLIPESIAAAEKQVESARAALDTAQTALDYTKILSPITGVIASLNAEVGELASPNGTNVTIIDPSSLDLVISVTDRDVLKLKEGLDVGITLDGISKSYKGVIKTIAPSAKEATALFEVTVRTDNASSELRAGMMASAQLSAQNTATALYVPKLSVVSEGSNSYVYLISGSSVKKVPVTLGAARDLYVELKNGVSADSTVVAEGADKLKDGDIVSILKSIG